MIIYVLLFYLRFRDGTYSECASNFVQMSEKWTDTLSMIRQAFWKESMSVHGCLKGTFGSGQTEKVETDEEQSHGHTQHFL
jgi:hypothetical protein